MNCRICLEPLSAKRVAAGFPQYHVRCLRALFGTETVSPVLDVDKSEFVKLRAEKSKGMSISGVQVKLSMKINNNRLIPTALDGEFILKPTPFEYENTSENEHASMLVGKFLGIDTPPLGLVPFSDGEFAYLIRRFDRRSNIKIHQEDLAQIMGISRDASGEYKYSASYEEAGNSLFEACGKKRVVVLRFFERLIYNFIIGNGDFHLKNISVMREEKNFGPGYDRLTPNYDCLHTKVHSPDEREFALPMLRDNEFTKSYEALGFATRADFTELGLRIGLLQRATSVVMDRMISAEPRIIGLLERSFLPATMLDSFCRMVTDRCKRLRAGAFD